MLWYGGSIAEAVNLSKQRNAIFVVFIEGENDSSVKMATMLDEAEISKRLSDENNFLAIKLTSTSTDYIHFAQMYQFVPVPSLFFIGRSGVPLEVVCPGILPAGLVERVDRILEEHKKSNPISLAQPDVQPSTSGQNIKQQTASLIQNESKNDLVESSAKAKDSKENEASEVPKETLIRQREDDKESTSGPAAKVQKTEDYEVVCDGDVCVRRPRSNPGPSAVETPATQTSEPEKPVESPYNAEEEIKKMERAKELIEIRRREKAEKEKELEKQRELERRATGQGVAELRRWQEEQEMKNIQEERKKEKLENSLARQRILEQIAQDRAERKAREAPTQPATNASENITSEVSGDTAAAPGGARLQFKMPDGGTLVANFSADDTFLTVRDHLAENLNLSKSQFSIWTAYPRRELTTKDDMTPLRALGLAPRAALLLLLAEGRAAAAAAAAAKPLALFSFLTTLFTSLVLDPSYQLYTWLRSRLFPPSGRATSGSGNQGGLAGNLGGIGGIQGGLRRRTGNIHRLTGDADDDNNTWNGNSTQQM